MSIMRFELVASSGVKGPIEISRIEGDGTQAVIGDVGVSLVGVASVDVSPGGWTASSQTALLVMIRTDARAASRAAQRPVPAR
jgi:hypothetical protein